MTFDQLWAELGPLGRDSRTGGYRRYAWTDVDLTLREWFGGECAARGLDLVEDRAGNLWGWWGDPDVLPGVVTGSHLDSVPDGGAYDGPLGVVSALAAIDLLRAEGVRPARPIGVVAFGDEEGARFGVACAGSRTLTGALAPDHALGLRDADGLSLADALGRAGRVPADFGPDPAALARIGCFVELHVEQGRALIDLGRPLGVGRDIWPHGRWRLDFTGQANHAGTTPLPDRHDALLGAAQVVLDARAAATEHGCLATVGKLEVRPGGVNAIPVGATAWLDARGAQADDVRRVVSQVAEQASARGGRLHEESWTPATVFDPDLAGELSRLLGDAPRLSTGAGHDAGVLAAVGIPTAMIFVRNPTGISHAPDEFAEPDDCAAGVAALADVLRDRCG